MTTEFQGVHVITTYAAPELLTLAQFLFDNRNGMTVAQKSRIEKAIAMGRLFKSASGSYILRPAGMLGLRAIAKIMRKPERHGDDLPWLIIHRGEVAGGTLELTGDRVNSWVPGCFAVPLDETLPIYVATGGDPMRGAEKWEVVP